MSKYKMVPVEPTDDMVDAGRSQSSFPLGVYKAMIAAAPAVQGEPAVFDEDAALSLAERTFSTEVDEQLASDIIQYAQRLHSLYTAPKPAEQQPDIARLVEALEVVMWFGCNPNSKRGMWALEKANSALAAYRKGAES